MTTEIHTRALLVWLNIRSWSARKYDRQITDRVNSEVMHASHDAGRYNKMLLPGDAPAYKKLVNLCAQIRNEHYAQTLAWSDEGWRLLSVAQFDRYTHWYRLQSAAFTSVLQDEFLPAYPDMKHEARSRLNGAYKEEDYPDPYDMSKRFAISVEYDTIRSSGDIRVDLASDQIQTLESQIGDRVQRAVGIALQDTATRIADVVGKVQEKLAVPDAIFRDSLIENVRELTDILPRLNVTDDPVIKTMQQQLLQKIVIHDPDVLRDNPSLRQTVADDAAKIVNTLKGIYQ